MYTRAMTPKFYKLFSGFRFNRRPFPIRSKNNPSDPLFTSTPLKKPLNQRPRQETKVQLIVEYPSKIIKKELKEHYAVIAKAIANGSPDRVANAVLKSPAIRKPILEKVLKLLTVQINGLCARKEPSILRAKTKAELQNFDCEKLCLEWKKRSPLFYAFLMTIATSNKTNSETTWLPSVAVAGSVLLKQRNAHMNVCATVIAILLKSRSLEVRIFFIISILKHAY